MKLSKSTKLLSKVKASCFKFINTIELKSDLELSQVDADLDRRFWKAHDSDNIRELMKIEIELKTMHITKRIIK